jgi:hypothetical protein
MERVTEPKGYSHSQRGPGANILNPKTPKSKTTKQKRGPCTKNREPDDTSAGDIVKLSLEGGLGRTRRTHPPTLSLNGNRIGHRVRDHGLKFVIRGIKALNQPGHIMMHHNVKLSAGSMTEKLGANN